MSRRLIAVKPIASLLAEARQQQSQFKRQLTLLDIVLLGIGVVIGTGIFVLTGHAAASNAGPAIAISFVIAGLAAALAGLCYSEMAAMIPITGSAYTYAYATIGELGAYLIGWDLILEYLLGAATVSAGWSGYFVTFVYRLSGWQIPQKWCQSLLIWDHVRHQLVFSGAVANLPAMLFALTIGVVLTIGIKESARFNAVMVFFKVMAIGLFLWFATPYIDVHNWTPFLPPNQGRFGHFGISGVLQGAGLVFFAYIGFDAISTVAQECHNPQRDLPRGILTALAVCTILYASVSLVLTGVVPYAQLSVPHPIAMGIAKLNQPWLELLIDFGALCGLTSGALVMLLGQPRIFYAMAKDGLFPRFALKTHPIFQTPYITTLLSCSLCALLAAILPIDVLGELTSVGTLFAFVLVSISVMLLRLQQPDLPRPFRVPFGPFVIPLSSAAISLLLLLSSPTGSLLRLLVWMAVGLLLYVNYGRKYSTLHKIL